MKFFVVDGSGFLYRSYYAFPAMPDQSWRNMNVVYGFFRMMFKLWLQRPDYFVIAWDSPVKTHRHEAFGEYKAQRKKMEDDFKYQIPLVQDLVARLGIPSLVVPWYEADDILYTMVHRFSLLPEQHISIISSDKDLKQLLSDSVVHVDTMKEVTTTVASFVQEYGFSPHFMGTYLALTGDSSDNIPGVPGIWPKKAQDLVVRFGTLEHIYQRLSELAPDLSSKLRDSQDLAMMSKSLVDLKLIPDENQYQLSFFVLALDIQKMTQILVHEYHFGSFAKPLDELRKILIMPVQNSLF